MINFEETSKDLFKEVDECGDIRFCYNCRTCISGCPASNANPPLLIRNLARMILLGMEDELFEEDTPWTCVTCSQCEEMCPMDVKPFELCLALRRWQSKNDETRIPPSITTIYSEGYTQAVSKVKDLRESVGLSELITIDKLPKMHEQFKAMLRQTEIVKENSYMFND